MKEPAPLKYIPFPDQQVPGDWRVEAIDEITRDAYVAMFAGPDAEFRANEYAKFKNGKHPVAKPETKTIEKLEVNHIVPSEITIEIQNGQKATFNPGDLLWTWNDNKKTISGKQKPLIELKGKN